MFDERNLYPFGRIERAPQRETPRDRRETELVSTLDAALERVDRELEGDNGLAKILLCMTALDMVMKSSRE